jgi:hypothetical protein
VVAVGAAVLALTIRYARNTCCPRDASGPGRLRGRAPIAHGNTFVTLKCGDVSEIEAPGVGTLCNTVMAEL